MLLSDGALSSMNLMYTARKKTHLHPAAAMAMLFRKSSLTSKKHQAFKGDGSSIYVYTLVSVSYWAFFSALRDIERR